MKKVFKFCGVGCLVLVLLGLVAIVISMVALSPEYHVEREVTITAQPARVHAYVGNLRRWPEWMPWNEELDPTMTTTFDGDGTSVGSTMSWVGDSVGVGSMTLLETDPATGIAYQLEQAEMATPGKGWISYEVDGDQTTVLWVDTGSVAGSGVVTPVLKLMVPMLEGMLGSHFEQGLASLKEKAEGGG